MKDSLKFFLLGLLTFVFGGTVLANATAASMAVVTLTGILLLLAGVFQIALGFWAQGTGSKAFSWGLGALTLFLGWSFLENPLEGVVSLTTILLILFAAAGLLQIMFAMRVKGTPFFWGLLLSGALSLILALVLLSSSEASMTLLGILLGFQLLSGGASLFMIGMTLRKSEVSSAQ
ncbi:MULTISPECIES: HdeD family acid-resistance protein [unclassified Falsihalocynthiibacter]|uniref:HdeD family acid-resistance protein n=1 Tax=unclassified Falsihalocynthiibacter TaxID=2854191 RepID=UPI00350F8DCC